MCWNTEHTVDLTFLSGLCLACRWGNLQLWSDNPMRAKSSLCEEQRERESVSSYHNQMNRMLSVCLIETRWAAGLFERIYSGRPFIMQPFPSLCTLTVALTDSTFVILDHLCQVSRSALLISQVSRAHSAAEIYISCNVHTLCNPVIHYGMKMCHMCDFIHCPTMWCDWKKKSFHHFIFVPVFFNCAITLRYVNVLDFFPFLICIFQIFDSSALDVCCYW